MLPASYTDLIRYDGAAVQRDRRDQTVPCAIQPRDVEILADIWRYKFLTATQLLELHWPDCAQHGSVASASPSSSTPASSNASRPVTRTVCQDDQQRAAFLHAADREL